MHQTVEGSTHHLQPVSYGRDSGSLSCLIWNKQAWKTETVEESAASLREAARERGTKYRYRVSGRDASRDNITVKLIEECFEDRRSKLKR